MLNVKSLCSGYINTEILHDISFTARPGEITAIIGPNGCGKSTLLKTISGIIPASNGSVYYNEADILKLSQQERARIISYLTQNRQVPDITAGRLVLHGRVPYLSYPRRYRKEDYEAAKKAMEDMGITELSDKPLSRLSGGMQQQVYIAMALAQDTDIILFDEPTTYLDIRNQMTVLKYMRRLADSGKTVIMVIHDIGHALETADHVLLMKEGRIIADGNPLEVYESGAIGDVFGIGIEKIVSASGTHYICT